MPCGAEGPFLLFLLQLQAEDYDDADAGVLQMPDEQERALMDDPFYRLEHGEVAKVKAKTEAERVADIW